MAEKQVGVYPGTFDPITNGHLDIIIRAATKVVDHLIVAVALNAGKGPLFTVEERCRMVEEQVVQSGKVDPSKIEVRTFDGLLVKFAADVGANVLVRGLRAVSDFEYEFQMAAMNSHLEPDVETVFLMASDRNQFISSRFVKEISMLGGDVRHFAPEGIADILEDKFGAK
ncbi:MAG: pantetheine-phosphate adenylyltransferase [Rickettsiales bacterium]|nr:pantetheine-phosphate adenylyltransferase [Rickettsiales bacterium]|tara:strand:+ start:1402 stop:1911 length:510 start_codon:yes stop_codon:yes gene_type:complete